MGSKVALGIFCTYIIFCHACAIVFECNIIMEQTQNLLKNITDICMYMRVSLTVHL